MGNETIKVDDDFHIYLNKRVQLSCDFTNCATFVYRSKCQLSKVKSILFSKHIPFPLSLYVIFEHQELGNLALARRRTSIMALSDASVALNYNNEMPVLENVSVLSREDVQDFTDVVFTSFGYDERYKQESAQLYDIGMQSKVVKLYGLKIDGKYVSVALSHSSDEMIGIELVSTLPEHRGKGYASFLIKNIITEESNHGYHTFWLFANEDGNAMGIYTSLGFKHIRKMDVIKLDNYESFHLGRRDNDTGF